MRRKRRNDDNDTEYCELLEVLANSWNR